MDVIEENKSGKMVIIPFSEYEQMAKKEKLLQKKFDKMKEEFRAELETEEQHLANNIRRYQKDRESLIREKILFEKQKDGLENGIEERDKKINMMESEIKVCRAIKAKMKKALIIAIVEVFIILSLLIFYLYILNN